MSSHRTRSLALAPVLFGLLALAAYAGGFGPSQGSSTGGATDTTGLTIPNHCALVMSTGMTLNNSDPEILIWDTEDADPAGMHDPPATQVTASGGRTLTYAAAGRTITASSGDFTADGFVAGMQLTSAGTSSNNGTEFTIESVTALVITITATSSDSVADEGPLSATATLDAQGSRVTIPTGAGGIYLITAGCGTITADVTDSYTQTRILISGVATRQVISGKGGASASNGATLSWVGTLSAGDYVEVLGRQNNGEAHVLGTQDTWLTVTQLASGS